MLCVVSSTYLQRSTQSYVVAAQQKKWAFQVISMEYPKGNTLTIPVASRNFPLTWDRFFLEPAISKPLIMFLISKGTFDPYSNFEIDSSDF